MNPADLRAIGDHLWQSTLFAAVAGLATLMLRANGARARYWLWLAASCKFLVPFSVLIALGGQMPWRTGSAAAQSGWSVAMEEAGRPFTASRMPVALLPAPPPPRDSLPFPVILAAIWVCGSAGIAVSWWIRWRRIRKTVRSASPLPLSAAIPVRSAANLLEPGVFGIWRPVLMLPEGIAERLSPEQMGAVVAHELCHLRYRDNLTAAVQMLVETVFWFHPLVWWIGKRMVEERERACDEEVVRLGSDPRVYAEGILNVCKLYVESPLACVAGVSGSNLRKRIAGILSNRAAVRLSLAKKAVLAGGGLAAVVLPMGWGVMNATALRAQSAPVERPKFEVAAIKPCSDRDVAPGGKRGGRGGGQFSPGALHEGCKLVIDLIKEAYVMFADGHVNPRSRVVIEGGPAWIQSARYQVDAKPEGAQNQGMMRGPMMQTLLEERFKLKIHHESRSVPAYALTVAKGGPKLHSFAEGSCTPIDWKLLEQFPPAPFPELPAGQSYCGGVDPDGRRWVGARSTMNGPNVVVDARALTIDEFIKQALSRGVDRPVINQTGITGRFDYHLEFAPEESTGGGREGAAGAATDLAGPSIFSALQQELGLKLEGAKGMGDFLVIDRVERPSGN